MRRRLLPRFATASTLLLVATLGFWVPGADAAGEPSSPAPTVSLSVGSELAAAGSALAIGPSGERATVFAAAHHRGNGRVSIEIAICEAPTHCERWYADADPTALQMMWDGIGGENPFLRSDIPGLGEVDLEVVTLGSVLGHTECVDQRIPVVAGAVASSLSSETVWAFIEGSVGSWRIAPDAAGCALWSRDALFGYGLGAFGSSY